MRIFALSDIHVDYDENKQWVQSLSRFDYQNDLLLMAGDVSHDLDLLAATLTTLSERFCTVLFTPGNHDLWVHHHQSGDLDSWHKFFAVRKAAEDCGISTQPVLRSGVLCVPLFGWYDYSFGEPSNDLKRQWTDFIACRWPHSFDIAALARRFAKLNPPVCATSAKKVITFSHFLPRIDLIPSFVPRKHRILDPVLGSTLLEEQLRRFEPTIHVYGHSHINLSTCLDGVTYINNALGYPQEHTITTKRLRCIYEI